MPGGDPELNDNKGCNGEVVQTHQSRPKAILDLKILEKSFYVERQVGEGSFAKVFKAFNKKRQRECALKIIGKDPRKLKHVHMIKREYDILRNFEHQNIIKKFGIHETKKVIALELEFMQGGSLQKRISRRNSQKLTFSEDEIQDIGLGLIKAVYACHTLNIVHRDIKPANILFSTENSPLIELKLSDFGLSGQYDYRSCLHHKVGTLIYMAPEILRENSSYGKPVDIWSVGILLFMLLNSYKHPLYKRGMSNKEFGKVMSSNKISNIDIDSLQCSNLGKDFISKCLEESGSMRINARRALQHPWITKRYQDPIPISLANEFGALECKQMIQKTLKILPFILQVLKEGNKRNIIQKEDNTIKIILGDKDMNFQNKQQGDSKTTVKRKTMSFVKRRMTGNESRSKLIRKCSISNLIDSSDYSSAIPSSDSDKRHANFNVRKSRFRRQTASISTFYAPKSNKSPIKLRRISSIKFKSSNSPKIQIKRSPLLKKPKKLRRFVQSVRESPTINSENNSTTVKTSQKVQSKYFTRTGNHYKYNLKGMGSNKSISSPNNKSRRQSKIVQRSIKSSKIPKYGALTKSSLKNIHLSSTNLEIENSLGQGLIFKTLPHIQSKNIFRKIAKSSLLLEQCSQSYIIADNRDLDTKNSTKKYITMTKPINFIQIPLNSNRIRSLCLIKQIIRKTTPEHMNNYSSNRYFISIVFTQQSPELLKSVNVLFNYSFIVTSCLNINSQLIYPIINIQLLF